MSNERKTPLPQEYDDEAAPICAVCKCFYRNDGEGTACPSCRADIAREIRAMYED